MKRLHLGLHQLSSATYYTICHYILYIYNDVKVLYVIVIVIIYRTLHVQYSLEKSI